MFEQLIETFDINNRINIYMLTSLNEEYLKDQTGSKGRTVGELLANSLHIFITCV